MKQIFKDVDWGSFGLGVIVASIIINLVWIYITKF